MRGVRRIRRQPLTEHRCPGACGRLIPLDRFACEEDWARLPGPIRARVVASQSASASPVVRTAVRGAAAQWFLDNPRVRPL